MPGSRIRRTIRVGNQTCLLGFSGRDSVDSGTFDASTIAPGGVDEVQTATITGTPTGGTLKFGFKGQVTAAIAYNATGATVQTELRKLSRVGSGVTVTGGAGGPWVVTFAGSKLGKQDQPFLTLANNSLTGGTSPSVTIAETTRGSSLDSGLLKIKSGTPVMVGANNKLVVWDGASATTLVGIVDGEFEALGPDDHQIVPVYNHECVFDKDVVLNYTTWSANYNTWAAAHVCQFKSQGS